MSDEERGYDVVDKRGGGSGGAAVDTSGAATGAGNATDSAADAADEFGDAGAGFGGEGAQMDATGIVRLAISMLSEVAVVKVGLVPNPMSGQMERDLPQARLAIDCVGDLANRLMPQLQGPELRDLQNLVADLRINYVKQSERP